MRLDGGEFLTGDHAFPDYWTAQNDALESVALTGTPAAIARAGADEPIATVTTDTVRLLRSSFRLLGLVLAGEQLTSMPSIEAGGGLNLVWTMRGDFITLRLDTDGTWSLHTVTRGVLAFVGKGSVDDLLPDDALLTIHYWLSAHRDGAFMEPPNRLRQMWEAVGCGVLPMDY